MPCDAGAYCATAGLTAVTGVCSSETQSNTTACVCNSAPNGIALVQLSSAAQNATRSNAVPLSVATSYSFNTPCFARATLVNLTFVWQQVLPPLAPLDDALVIGGGLVASPIADDSPPALALAPLLSPAPSTLVIPAFALRSGRTYVVRVNMTAAVSTTGASVTASALFAVGVVAHPPARREAAVADRPHAAPV